MACSICNAVTRCCVSSKFKQRYFNTKVWTSALRMSSTNIKPSSRYLGSDKNVWIEFTTLAAKHDAVNLGQGFPDFSPPEHVKSALRDVVTNEPDLVHQYSRGFGHPLLVEKIAELFGPKVGKVIDPATEVMVTIGAYGSLFSAISAFVGTGDEVIIIEPFFDCYEPMVKIAGGIPRFIPLRPKDNGAEVTSSSDWTLDSEELAALFSDKTKAIVLNTPNNPLGKVFSRAELQEISALCVKHDVLCISDEVYEWLTFDGTEHVRMASLPGMWERTLTIGSAGKTFSVTGWKLGWTYGPRDLMKHLMTVWQNTVYNCPTAQQIATARAFEVEISRLGSEESYFHQLPRDLARKRDFMKEVFLEVGLRPILPQGGYFMIADASGLNVELDEGVDQGESWDYRVVKWLTRHKKVATIPTTAFFSSEHKGIAEKYIRFCFCKEDETINKMADIFREWSKSLK